MSDVDRLKEAVDRGTVQVEHGMPLMPSVAHDLLAAARLVVAGQPLSYCELHMSNGLGPRCDVAITAGTGAASPCRMVEGVWVPTGKDET